MLIRFNNSYIYVYIYIGSLRQAGDEMTISNGQINQFFDKKIFSILP